MNWRYWFALCNLKSWRLGSDEDLIWVLYRFTCTFFLPDLGIILQGELISMSKHCNLVSSFQGHFLFFNWLVKVWLLHFLAFCLRFLFKHVDSLLSQIHLLGSSRLLVLLLGPLHHDTLHALSLSHSWTWSSWTVWDVTRLVKVKLWDLHDWHVVIANVLNRRWWNELA